MGVLNDFISPVLLRVMLIEKLGGKKISHTSPCWMPLGQPLKLVLLGWRKEN